MKFSSKEACDRYLECRQFAVEHRMLDNLSEVFARLLAWERYDEFGNRTTEVVISRDFCDKSFAFAELDAQGNCHINGGIIFHGVPGKYVENGSVMLSPSYGWQIHT